MVDRRHFLSATSPRGTARIDAAEIGGESGSQSIADSVASAAEIRRTLDLKSNYRACGDGERLIRAGVTDHFGFALIVRPRLAQQFSHQRSHIRYPTMSERVLMF
jgi:hypothetical protein